MVLRYPREVERLQDRIQSINALSIESRVDISIRGTYVRGLVQGLIVFFIVRIAREVEEPHVVAINNTSTNA
eukprot:scaffold2599_cov125-Cylindrotheca_fusiformis.AAC.12